MNRIAIALLLVLGCAGADATQVEVPQQAPERPQIPVGVGEVNGLPGTPLEVSPRGIPLIEGIERPDYAEDGINSFAQRWERVTPDNPTGEYRFPLDELGPDEWIADADDKSGFRDGLEQYTWRLMHPNFVSEKGIWKSNIFHGKAFSTNSDGSINEIGACWLSANAGKDCEFPASKSRTWRLAWGDSTGDSFSTCNHDPSIGGTHAPGFYSDPSDWIQEGFNKWKPEATMTQTSNPNSGAGEQITVYCEPMPGSPFGAILGRSGGFGATTRRVTNAHDAYSCNPPTGSSFPKGLFTYGLGDIRYSADNMYQRALLCTSTAQQSSADMFHFAAVNMFAHEMGHFLGFSHFSTGVMATGGDCGLFYSQFRDLPAVFHDAMANFTPTSGTFNFVNPGCVGDILLPAPLPNNQQFPFGRLFQ